MQRALLLTVFGAMVAAGQPVIYARGIVNAASSLPSGIPAGGIARGSLFTIYGRSLGPSVGVSASAYPLQTSLANVTITITSGTQPVSVLPVFVSAGQINALMPSNAPLGQVSLRVRVGSAQSNPLPVRVVANSPGIFTARGTGAGPGVIQNFVTQADQPVNTPQVAAKPGQVITLWATGLGAVANDTVAPTAGDLPVTVEVFAGGKLAQKLYSGRAPCCAGTDQIVFQLPNDVPTGCWVPVYLRVAGAVVSNTVTMAITADGTPCRDSAVASTLMAGGRMGIIAPMRVDIRQVTADGTLDLRTDFVMTRLADERSSVFPFNPLISLPPAGTCTSYSGAGDWFTTFGMPDVRPGVGALNGGGMTVSGGGRSRTFPSVYSPLSIGLLGALNPALTRARDTTILAPGTLTLQSAGGADVPSFTRQFTMPAPFTWTNRDQVTSINRAQSLTLNWSGAAGLDIAVIGGSVDLPMNSSSVFVCTGAAGATSITVPAAVLANLPPGRGSTRDSKAVVFVVGSSPATTFETPGLNTGPSGFQRAFLMPTYVVGKAVTVQ